MKIVCASTILAIAICFATQDAIAAPSSTCGEYDRGKLKNPSDGMRAESTLQDCLHHNAVRLSSAPDTADAVAKAVVILCETAIRDAVKEDDVEKLGTTFDDMYRAAKRVAFDTAYLAVIEARAGHCGPE